MRLKTKTIALPRLNNLTPTLESTALKLMEEAGELAQAIGKFRGLSGEYKTLDEQRVVGLILRELLDVAQTAVSLLFVIEEKYGADIGAALERHVQKLIDKGYLCLEWEEESNEGAKKKIKILSIFGTRPEAIKMAPVVKELGHYSNLIESRVVVTAQHREMLDQVLQVFDLYPDYDLAIMRPDQNLFDVTEAVLKGLYSVLAQEKPDLVLVQGDTTTTFAGALAAFYFQIPVGHVEAGLRTYDKYVPFPEEINRVLTSHLAELHFAPTEIARSCLLREGIPGTRVFLTGNTVIDALYLALEQPCELDCELDRVLSENKRVILLTTHRRENLGKPLGGIYTALKEIISHYPDVGVIFPVHKNPHVRREVARLLAGVERIYLTEPLEYLAFVNVMKRAYLVLTDSGGIQEEAPALGKPVLVLREVTERPEAIAAGTALLVGTDPDGVEAEVSRLLEDERVYARMSGAPNPYGDGQAARRIVQAVLSYFNLAPIPDDFKFSWKENA